MTVRITNATYDLERGGKPNILVPHFFSAPFLDRYE